jgi:hypothetical protein
VLEAEDQQPAMARISFSHSGPGNPFVPLPRATADLSCSSTPPTPELYRSSTHPAAVADMVAVQQQQQQQGEQQQQQQQGALAPLPYPANGVQANEGQRQKQQEEGEEVPCSDLAPGNLDTMRKRRSTEETAQWVTDSAMSTRGGQRGPPLGPRTCSSAPGSHLDYYAEFHTGDGE